MVQPSYESLAARATEHVLEEELNLVSSTTFVETLLDAVPLVCAVLNKHRQILLINNRFSQMINPNSLENVHGARPGEILGCPNAALGRDGCGTSPLCKFCATSQAFLGTLDTESEEIREGNMTVAGPDGPVSMTVRATSRPFLYQGRNFVTIVLEDITIEKERRILERAFFHDILNTAGGLAGVLSSLTEEPDPDRELLGAAEKAALQVFDEISFHKLLVSAENSDLTICQSVIDLKSLIEESVVVMTAHPVAARRNVRITQHLSPVSAYSDKAILKRIIVNALKNAIEASTENQEVTITCIPSQEEVRIEVHNVAAIAEEARHQIFQRFYSTKGPGRGIGTYSMKLLTEKFLGGTISFSTGIEQGTTFLITLPHLQLQIHESG